MEASNIKAMREALEDVLDKIDKWRTDGTLDHWQYSQLFDIADAALAAPPRNCDKYATEAEARKAFLGTPCAHPCGDCTVQEGEDALYHECGVKWLLAPATEQKGGTDGR